MHFFALLTKCFFLSLVIDGCTSIIIPSAVTSLRTLNTTENKWLASICGRSTEYENGGRRYPWAVSIMQNGQNRLGGTIISPYHILTAAHGFTRFFFRTDGGWASEKGERCQFNGFRHVNNREVAFGDDCIRVHMNRDFRQIRRTERILRYHTAKQRIDQSSVIIQSKICRETSIQINKIKAVYMDDGFVSGGCIDGHDWMILEVVNKISFATPAVRPICLPKLSEFNEFERDLLFNPLLMIVSWGRPNVFTDSSPRIREIPMLYDPTCRPPWSDAMPTDVEDYICAKAQNPNDDASPRTCHGDSGAGMETRDINGRAYLLGITSFGSKMCPSNELARFTRTSTYLKAICAITGVCYTI